MTPLAVKQQSPIARRRRGFDYTKFLGKLGPDVRITESTWRSSAPEFKVSDDAILDDGRKVAVWTEGGLDGKDYAVTNEFVTSDGHRDERSFTVRVRSGVKHGHAAA